MTRDETIRLLGANRAVDALSDLGPRLPRSSCRFMRRDDYMPLRQKDIPAAMRIYWLELLYRASFAASAAIIRHDHWLEAIILAVAHNNFFAFSAGLRALIESPADTHHALASVPVTLAENIATIRSAVKGKLQRPVECVLEADLIHFLYGRSTTGGEARLGHQTLKIVEYLRSLERDETVGIEECWRELCQITHPSAFTVLRFLQKEPDGSIRLGETDDAETIIDFCRGFAGLLTFVVNLPVMQCLLILRVLNGVGVAEIETRALPTYGLESTEIWKDIEDRLRVH